MIERESFQQLSFFWNVFFFCQTLLLDLAVGRLNRMQTMEVNNAREKCNLFKKRGSFISLRRRVYDIA